MEMDPPPHMGNLIFCGLQIVLSWQNPACGLLTMPPPPPHSEEAARVIIIPNPLWQVTALAGGGGGRGVLRG